MLRLNRGFFPQEASLSKVGGLFSCLRIVFIKPSIDLAANSQRCNDCYCCQLHGETEISFHCFALPPLSGDARNLRGSTCISGVLVGAETVPHLGARLGYCIIRNHLT